MPSLTFARSYVLFTFSCGTLVSFPFLMDIFRAIGNDSLMDCVELLLGLIVEYSVKGLSTACPL